MEPSKIVFEKCMCDTKLLRGQLCRLRWIMSLYCMVSQMGWLYSLFCSSYIWSAMAQWDVLLPLQFNKVPITIILDLLYLSQLNLNDRANFWILYKYYCLSGREWGRLYDLFLSHQSSLIKANYSSCLHMVPLLESNLSHQPEQIMEMCMILETFHQQHIQTV